MHIRAYGVLLLVAAVGCFARVPNAAGVAPTPAVTPAPVATSVGNPQEPEPPVDTGKSSLERLTFTKLFSWSITGETPQAAWSPDRKSLAISSYDPQQIGKKYLKIFDLTTGSMSADVTVSGAFEYPEWISNSTLGFSCPEELCGKDKAGVYLLSATGKIQKILPLGPNTSATLYPTQEALLILVTEQPPYPGRGLMPEPIYTRYQMDLTNQTISPLEKGVFHSKTSATFSIYACRDEVNELFSYSNRGKMIIGSYNEETERERIFMEAIPYPKYSGDISGVSPCFSPDVTRGIYYSVDPKTKLGVATLLLVRGYQPPPAYR